MKHTLTQTFARIGLLALIGTLSGCQDPLSMDDTSRVRRDLIRSIRMQTEDVVKDAGMVEMEAYRSKVYDEPKFDVEELDRMSGPGAYEATQIELGKGLDGVAAPTVRMGLQRAVALAVAHNLDVKLAQIIPAISEAQVVEAEAAFDAVFFNDFSFTKTDRPQPVTVVGGIPVGTAMRKEQAVTLTTGIRKQLDTGGQFSVATGFDYVNNKTPAVMLAPDPAFTTNVSLSISQPLLRNFGSRVNRAQIALNRNSSRKDWEALHAQLLNTVALIEQAYWELVFAHHQLAVQQRLLKHTEEAYRKVDARKKIDAGPIEVSQALNALESRMADVVRARQTVHDTSDQLKRMLNSPDLPLAGQTVIVPTDKPVELPVRYSQLDAVLTALRYRPEVRLALLNIDDASIRQAVADNQRLPLLTLGAQIQYFGLATDLDESYEQIGEADFIEYLLTTQFELPIGNRAAEAAYSRARLSRHGNVVAYQSAVQDVVLSVKLSLRALAESYTLIPHERAARHSAAQNLTAILAREELDEALTPEFLLDLKLSTQQRLADAELREGRAMVDYNIALVAVHQSTGTLLEQNNIELTWPEDMFDR